MRFAALVSLALLAFAAQAQDVTIRKDDTAQSVLEGQKGKRVTVRTKSGQELTGVVRDVSGRLVVLGALSGREFFDAVVPLDSVEAVLIRTK